MIRSAMRFLPLLSALVWLLVPGYAGAADTYPSAGVSIRTPASLDGLLAAAFKDIRANKPDSALASVNRLIALHPDFKLAYLIKGDLLLAKTRELPGIGAAPVDPANRSLDGLKDEARVRLMHYVDQPDPHKLPAQILQLAPNQKYALLADAERARLFVFENVGGEPHLIHDYYLSVGKKGVGKHSEGDKRSPLGVYSLSPELPRSQLTSFYGAGAFPLDYPNEWDQEQGNGGHGIWLHGVPPDTYSRPPKTSDGCLVLANPDWKDVARYIRPENTPLVITQHSEWLDRDAWLAKRQALLSVLDSWTNDWEKKNAGGYMAHYSPELLSKLGKSWVAAKERNISQKNWIQVSLSDLSLFMYDDDSIAVVNLTQHYRSDKLNDITRKNMYLKLENGHWRIAMEKTLQSSPSASSSALALKD